MKQIMKKGFTLIELLVVIAIIGILAALIIVSLSGARAKAQDTQSKNKVRNLATAQEQYATDNTGNYWGHTTPVQAITTGGGLATALASYVTAGATSAIFDKTSGVAAYQYISGTGGACTAVTGIGPNATKWGAAISLKSDSEPANVSNAIYAIGSSTITINGCTLTGMTAETNSTKAFGAFGPN